MSQPTLTQRVKALEENQNRLLRIFLEMGKKLLSEAEDENLMWSKRRDDPCESEAIRRIGDSILDLRQRVKEVSETTTVKRSRLEDRIRKEKQEAKLNKTDKKELIKQLKRRIKEL